MTINYSAVFLCAVLAILVGWVWYGLIFGKKWIEIVGADVKDIEARKKMQRSAGPLYLIQFLLTLFQAYVLAHYIVGSTEVSGLENSLWIFSAFVLPIVAGSSMWNNDSKKVALTRFFIQTGYQLVIFILFGLILGGWK